jgi:hypothetical protein
MVNKGKGNSPCDFCSKQKVKFIYTVKSLNNGKLTRCYLTGLH